MSRTQRTPTQPASTQDEDFDWFDDDDDADVGRPAGVPAGPAGAVRLREYVADRVPLGLRGPARVPAAAALAGLLVAVAVVAGMALRAHADRVEFVDVQRAPTSGAAAGPRTVRSVPPAGSGSGQTGSTVARSAVAGATGQVGPATSDAGSRTGSAVVVDVVGRVRRPGLVSLPAGSRVADAVAAAGGPSVSAVLARINLARLLVDGEQVLVPDADDPVPPVGSGPVGAASGAGSGTAGVAPAGPLDLNTATAAALDGLPGVGPVLAGRIIAWRAEHNAFTRVEELAEVAGIGEKLVEQLRPLVRI